jgi:hypothetical protein
MTSLTPKQQAILALVPRAPGKVSSTEIANALYRDKLNAQPIVIDALRKIAAKLDADPTASLRVVKGRRQGPTPQNFWLESKA